MNLDPIEFRPVRFKFNRLCSRFNKMFILNYGPPGQGMTRSLYSYSYDDKIWNPPLNYDPTCTVLYYCRMLALDTGYPFPSVCILLQLKPTGISSFVRVVRILTPIVIQLGRGCQDLILHQHKCARPVIA